ncbi:MAG: hypothetical protein KIT31_33010 [Deltaproteobacteria bacterium]|nr:hypothetical protein [Deltaproteobacteria bacterium]
MRWMLACALLGACASAEQAGSNGAADAGPTTNGDGAPATPDAPQDPRRGWIDLGDPPGAAAGDAQAPRLAMWNGAPVVAYSADQHVRVYAYANDSAWTAVGDPLRHSSAANVVTYDPTPVAGADGLSVVWPEWSGGAMTSAVRRLANGAWVAPPGAASVGAPNAYSFVPHSTAAVDRADGSMWLAYSETLDINAPMRISVVSILGSTVALRGSSISATGTNSGALAPELAIGGGAQFMTWTENGVRLAKRNPATGAWEAYGQSPLALPGRDVSSHANPHLAVDDTGRPIVAFTSYDGAESSIYVARWEGTAWSYWAQALQATPGPVGNMTSHTYLYDIVAAGPDVAYVAWSELDASMKDGIYVYRCTPAGCAKVGRGRLTPGYGPRLAVDGAGRVLVTWIEAGRPHVWRYHGDPDAP